MLKFRTMVPEAERLQPSLEHLNEAQGPVFKIKNDPRITPYRAYPAQNEPRRTATTLQRYQGRHESGGPATTPTAGCREV